MTAAIGNIFSTRAGKTAFAFYDLLWNFQHGYYYRVAVINLKRNCLTSPVFKACRIDGVWDFNTPK